ncbi:MAG: hypothetical protein ACP6IP_05180 [Candidatus Njordarchaeia archaeon]
MAKVAATTILLLFITLTFVASASALPAQYLTYSKPLKKVYKQNEELMIVGTIFNNRSLPIKVLSFNAIVESPDIRGRNATIYANVSKEVNLIIEVNHSLTSYIDIPLKNFLPDKYNVTAYFVFRYLGEEIQKAYVIEDVQIRVKPYVEIPPIVMIILMIMLGIVIVFIGYGLTGIFTKKKKS